MKKDRKANAPKRILGRELAREIPVQELAKVVGGNGTVSLDMPSGDPGD
ncbi:MAG: hypothetical protein GY719_36565 [bacterium]|nr:hypothetical protein [bacterium]